MSHWSNTKSWIAPIAAVVLGCTALGVIAHRNQAHAQQGTVQPTTGTGTTQAQSAKPLTQAQAQAASMVDLGTPMYGKKAPGFTLTNQFGKQMSLKQFRGKVVVLSFVDSQCTTICPLTTQDMVNAVQMLGPKAAKDIAMVGIDANPQAISVSDVMQYSKEHHMTNDWNFLTGSLSQLKQTWKNYNVESQIVNGLIDHTPALYVIDPQGKEQVLYMTPSTYSSVAAETSILAKDIEKYLPAGDRPKVKSVEPQAIKKTPADKVTLPKVEHGKQNGTETLGPGKPTLTLFLASWAPDAKMALQQLSRYQSEAGAPNIRAVDVTTVESTKNTFLKWDGSLSNVTIPVALDETGKVADAYKISDLMWLTLTNKQGKILWSHDGWMPIKQVRAIYQRAMNGQPIKVQ